MNKTQIALHLIDLLLNLFLAKEEKKQKKKELEKDKKQINDDPVDYFNDRYGDK